jgi:hypothetical protein
MNERELISGRLMVLGLPSINFFWASIKEMPLLTQSSLNAFSSRKVEQILMLEMWAPEHFMQ